MPVIELKEPSEQKLVVPNDLLKHFWSTNQSAEQYEAALKLAAPIFEAFTWDPSNPRVVGVPMTYADRTSVSVLYDTSYYVGPSDMTQKLEALKAAAKLFASIYLTLHPEKRVCVTMQAVNSDNPSQWPTVYYSTPKVA